MVVIHYVGTVVGLIINLGFLIAIYRRHVRRDFKIDVLWSKFVKEEKLNGKELEE